MKVLVATSQTQGDRDNDFCYCIEGELVWIGLVCATDRQDPDGGCGCGRSFAGMNSHQATTTVRVADIGDRLPALRGSAALEPEGPGLADPERHHDGGRAGAGPGDGFPIGAVVERRLDVVRWRVQSPAHGE